MTIKSHLENVRIKAKFVLSRLYYLINRESEMSLSYEVTHYKPSTVFTYQICTVYRQCKSNSCTKLAGANGIFVYRQQRLYGSYKPSFACTRYLAVTKLVYSLIWGSTSN